MITSVRFALAASLLALLASPLSAQWSFGVKGGATAYTSGDFHRGPSFDGSVLLGLAPGSLPVDVDTKSFDDVYGTLQEFGIEVSYQATPNLSYQLGVSRLSSNGSGTLRVGTVAGTEPLNGRFSEYEDLQAYVGARYDFNVSGKWSPYISGQLGVKRVDDISASFSVPGVTFDAPFQAALTNAKFYDRSTVWTAGLLVGLEYKFTANAAVGIETGYLAQGQLDDNDSVVGLLGLNSLNDEGSLGYIPVRLSLRYSF